MCLCGVEHCPTSFKCVPKSCWKVGVIICGVIGIACGLANIAFSVLLVIDMTQYECRPKAGCELYYASLTVSWIASVAWWAHLCASLLLIAGVFLDTKALMSPYLVTGFVASIITCFIYLDGFHRTAWIGICSIATALCEAWLILAWCNGGLPEGDSSFDFCFTAPLSHSNLREGASLHSGGRGKTAHASGLRGKSRKPAHVPDLSDNSAQASELRGKSTKSAQVSDLSEKSAHASELRGTSIKFAQASVLQGKSTESEHTSDSSGNLAQSSDSRGKSTKPAHASDLLGKLKYSSYSNSKAVAS